MSHKGHFASLLAIGLLVVPQSIKNPAFELYSQDNGGPAEGSAWDALTKGVDDSDPGHRKTAFAATGTIGTMKEAVEMVERGLQDKDREVRQVAANTLGEMGAKDAIPRLKAVLNDSPDVSFTAARALWKLGDEEDSRDVFQAVLAGERKDTPGKMRNTVKTMKKKLNPGELALIGAKSAASVLGPGSFTITAVQEAMKEAKKDGAAPGRAIAAETLAKDSDPYSLVLLEWALNDDSWAVRVAVAKALGERGNQETVPKLKPLLADDHHAVRYIAAASIIRLNRNKSGQRSE